ncbi:MAG TPA: shikimate kinase [Rhizomicrobium sp.]|jgi:shikimate kinase|nr:shikimate kinase [Rhizomicrobium sp.]
MILKLKRTPGIYLLGFMASGKSTVGRAVADQLGWSFADIDAEIEREQTLTIAQIFEHHGEFHFRDIESDSLRRHIARIEAGVPWVLALGGGATVRPSNWEMIRNNGVTIWLDCPLEIIRRRLGDDVTRPLARDRTRLAELYETRRPLYSKADFRIEVDSDDVHEAARRILQLPIF